MFVKAIRGFDINHLYILKEGRKEGSERRKEVKEGSEGRKCRKAEREGRE